MHRFVRAIASVACGLGIAGLVQAQSVERPDWKPGYTWTLRANTTGVSGGGAATETVRTVSTVRDDGSYTVSIQPAGSADAPTNVRATRDLNTFVKAANGEWQEFRWLQWPLEPGRTYSITSGAFTWDGKVEGWESVTVPAGTFKAIRISFTRSGPSKWGASETIWFVPEMKAVARRIAVRPDTERGQSTTTTEVVSFKTD